MNLLDFTKKKRRIWPAFLPSALAATLSCGPKNSLPEAAPELIVPKGESTDVRLALQDVVIPASGGSTRNLLASEFVGGRLGDELLVGAGRAAVDLGADEANARVSGVFVGSLGFLWTITPSQPVNLTLTARDGAQTVRREPSADGRLSVSLGAFSNVFPPAFREIYELVVSSVDGAPKPFSYSYTFAVRRQTSTARYSAETSQPLRKIYIPAQPNPKLLIGWIEPATECSDCSLSLDQISATAARKDFVELPAIPEQTKFRITKPARFQGLVVSRSRQSIEARAETDSKSGRLNLYLNVSAEVGRTDPWCQKSGGASPPLCSLDIEGKQTPTYFGSVNAVPKLDDINLLGGSGGLAWMRFTATGRLRVSRQGVVVEDRVVHFDSGDISPLDDPALPDWAENDIRQALSSGAPEFSGGG